MGSIVLVLVLALVEAPIPRGPSAAGSVGLANVTVPEPESVRNVIWFARLGHTLLSDDGFGHSYLGVGIKLMIHTKGAPGASSTGASADAATTAKVKTASSLPRPLL